MQYDPPRQKSPAPPQNALEIDLVFNVRPCGTCGFFWPADGPQPYGPYSTYDFPSDTPQGANPQGQPSFVWIQGVTRPPSFPDAEVMDGCRKAPVMTIGINPNLTAFAPGLLAATWCYPSFSSDDGTDSWTKYAYYYRYRSLYQEHLDLAFVKQFLLPEGRVNAAKSGTMLSVPRANADPSYEMRVRYDGDDTPTAIHLAGVAGQSPYVVLVDVGQRFEAGDLLAARVAVPGGNSVEVYAQTAAYYLQMMPVMERFETFLRSQGHTDAHLRVGEDVGQLDMVGCASPHWGPQWLGGTTQGVNTVVSNCVQKNAWAMKQLVQARPAVLFLVGQASWNMFRNSFGHLIRSQTPLPAVPEDGPYTLLRLTANGDCRFEFSAQIDGLAYSLSTRVVITPHFSYNDNFLPQFRMSPDSFAAFRPANSEAAAFLQNDPRIQFQSEPGSYVVAGIRNDPDGVLAELQQKYPVAWTVLQSDFYDPHEIMAGVLRDLYPKYLSFTSGQNGGFLTRSDGPCEFCENDKWKFPLGCPYGKPLEPKYPIGFLEKVVAVMLARSGLATR
jgi:hypothetical protein